MMRVRLRDIANELGVSTVTVWKALRNHSDISLKTRDLILQRVKERGYRPNLAARGLVTGRSSLIGLVVPDLIHPFFAEVAKSLSFALRQHGYLVIIASSEEDPLLEIEEIENLLSHHLDALVVASAQKTFAGLKLIEKNGTPLVLLDRSLSPSSNFVGVDDYRAGCLAAEHLLEIGCKRCAHIRGPENSVGRRRFEGFRDTLEGHGAGLNPKLVIAPLSFDVDGRKRGSESMKRLLARNLAFDGLFCFNDAIAIGAMGTAFENDLRVPDDLAVIGCGNLHYDDSLRVPLSSIDQSSDLIGKRIAGLLLDLFKGEATQTHQQIILSPQLVVRASTNKAAPSIGTIARLENDEVKAKSPNKSAPAKSPRRSALGAKSKA